MILGFIIYFAVVTLFVMIVLYYGKKWGAF